MASGIRRLQLQRQRQIVTGIVECAVEFYGLAQLRDRFIQTAGMNVGHPEIAINDEGKRIEFYRAFSVPQFRARFARRLRAYRWQTIDAR